MAELYSWSENVQREENSLLEWREGEYVDWTRACSTFNTSEDIIYGLGQREGGIDAFNRLNSIEITPSQYLKDNP